MGALVRGAYRRSGRDDPPLRLEVDAERQRIVPIEKSLKVEAMTIAVVVGEDQLAFAERPATLTPAIFAYFLENLPFRDLGKALSEGERLYEVPAWFRRVVGCRPTALMRIARRSSAPRYQRACR